MAFAKRGGHGQGDLGFGKEDLGAVAGNGGLHFLFAGDGECAALFGLGPGNTGIGLGLIGL